MLLHILMHTGKESSFKRHEFSDWCYIGLKHIVQEKI